MSPWYGNQIPERRESLLEAEERDAGIGDDMIVGPTSHEFSTGHFDAIIIGAGHIGLDAGAHLARAGLGVLVLDPSKRDSAEGDPGIDSLQNSGGRVVSLWGSDISSSESMGSK